MTMPYNFQANISHLDSQDQTITTGWGLDEESLLSLQLPFKCPSVVLQLPQDRCLDVLTGEVLTDMQACQWIVCH